LEDLSLGKTTLKSFFSSKSGKEKDILNLQAAIEQANVDIENYRKLINFITIYHGQMAIDRFKKNKIQQYTKMLQSMSTRSIHNAFLNATLNQLILETFEKI
jgi:sorting nexin-1/2